jgi:ElaB/YqjD/DUF883 family membrane-anchored ribosome-binding protein
MDTNEIKEQGSQVAEEFQEKGRAWAGRAKEKFQNVASVADDYAHENVWMTAGLVALAAVAIGWLIGRRS